MWSEYDLQDDMMEVRFWRNKSRGTCWIPWTTESFAPKKMVITLEGWMMWGRRVRAWFVL